MSDYKSVLNAHAMSVLGNKPSIPDYHLMVGDAEELSPLPLMIYEQTSVPTFVAENMQKFYEMNNDDLVEMINNNQLEVNDMNGNVALIGLEGIF